ncbi:MAG TPA: hypothetical protein PKH77_17545 [Anaerolineae bacterium]|nr:hypothetical protein [Anaerolineae bacterium]
MELINRYVYQVGRRLPQRTRADVEQELRSLLLDALEERTGRAAEFTEDEQVAVLAEFGPPEKMADKYRPQPHYVIGPKVFDLYLLVVSVIAGAGLLVGVITTAVSLLASDEVSVLELLLRAVTIFMNIALSGVGSATLTFALLERLIPDEEFKLDDDKPWNPRDLPAVEVRDEIKRANLIAEIAFMALLIMGLLAFGERISGVYYDGTWHATPTFLSATFFSVYLPLCVARWGLTILLNLALLRQGRWQLGTRIADLLFHGLDIYILGRLLSGPSVVNVDALRVAFINAPEVTDIMTRLLDSGLKIGFLIALIVTLVEVATRVYWLIRDYRVTPATAPIL